LPSLARQRPWALASLRTSTVFIIYPQARMPGLLQWLLGLFNPTGASRRRSAKPGPPRFTIDDLTRRLGMTLAELQATPRAYRTFQISKRTGGSRTISAPNDALKRVQRRILRRLLRKLKAHPSAVGFERGYSIVSNARPHVGQAVVIKLDLQNFFGTTTATRVREYFRFIGWDDASSDLLTSLCTDGRALPQGAPTSPRLSNLLNVQLDARIAALAEARDAAYSRYADDITLSFAPKPDPAASPQRINDLIHTIRDIVSDYGYSIHMHKKLRIARRHDRQVVTGLVVNDKVNLPRHIRRYLRAVEHHLATGRPGSLTSQQLNGWQALREMVKVQASTNP
jgi:retron-type reverse transcriptase